MKMQPRLSLSCKSCSYRKCLELRQSFFPIFCLRRIRKLVSEVLELQSRNQDDERDKELNTKIVLLSKHLPEPVKAHEFLRKFSAHMSKDPSLLQMMETVMHPSVSCKTCSEVMVSFLPSI
jgi:sister chromatid cohesion protein PDS5